MNSWINSKFWRKLRMMLSFIETLKRDYNMVPATPVKSEFDWLLSWGDIFKVPLSSLMIRVSHCALPSLLMEEKEKRQFNHHSHCHTLSIASQIMEAKANKTNKNKITTAKKISWKEKVMYFSPCFLYHLTFALLISLIFL